MLLLVRPVLWLPIFVYMVLWLSIFVYMSLKFRARRLFRRCLLQHGILSDVLEYAGQDLRAMAPGAAKPAQRLRVSCHLAS